MRIVAASGNLRRPDAEVDDLTASARTGRPAWDGDDLVIPYDPEPTPAEQTLIRRRLMTRDTVHEAWVADVVAARAASNTAALVTLLADAALRGIDAP